jgi:multidrug efflux pump subunit AcrA (membrane-fusion protein)/GAF domain-containing protein
VESNTLAATPPYGTTPVSLAADALHDATLELLTTEDAGAIAGKALAAAGRVLVVEGTSIWVPSAGRLYCRGAIGEDRERLSGTSVPPEELEQQLEHEREAAVAAAPIDAGDRTVAVLRVTRSLAAHGPFQAAERDALRRLTAAAGAALVAANRLAASERAAADSARELGLITEMSREITSTLDLDRVLRTVVNLASKALRFDRGAIALYEHGVCDIRAVAGAEGVDAKDTALQDLAVRAAWAAGVGESFYLSERTDPGSDAERTFVQIFGEDLERDGAMSGLYLPLKDEEGIVGILLFEAARSDFATPRERDLAAILANQSTVAVRNARLYRQVPLASAIGAISAKKAAWTDLPAQRRRIYLGAAAVAVAALTLIRWPMRVTGVEPLFRPMARAEVRPTLPGVIDRVFVHEGMLVDRGAPVAHLRDDERRAERDASLAAVAAAERTAAMAASRGDAGEERLQQLRVDVLRRDAELLDEQIRSSIVRAPVRGVILTARPDERVGSHAAAGDLIAVVGRTDSLELEFGVGEHDITRVQVGDEVRLRIAALPQRTFSGRVSSIGATSSSAGGAVSFPVRAVVANPEGLLRPGMAAHARVLTEPASALWRLARAPVRAMRLAWWRFWS